MENYALYLLENALRDELGYLKSADEVIRTHNNDIPRRGILYSKHFDNFRESKRKAEERIPQIERAIFLIKSDGDASAEVGYRTVAFVKEFFENALHPHLIDRNGGSFARIHDKDFGALWKELGFSLSLRHPKEGETYHTHLKWKIKDGVAYLE